MRELRNAYCVLVGKLVTTLEDMCINRKILKCVTECEGIYWLDVDQDK